MIDGADFDSFAQYIKELKSSGIPIILVYGGGSQITSKYKELTGKDREKGKDGLNYTCKELIEKGVIPVYDQLKNKFEDTFGVNNINAFDANDIMCDQISKLGEVGVVDSFLKGFSKDKINIVPFVGKNKLNDDILNVNADDVVNKIASLYKDKIINIIFLTKTGGINNNGGKVVPFLTMEKVEEILKPKNLFEKFLEEVNIILGLKKSCINVDGGMQKKLASIYDLLKKGVSKVTISSLSGLKDELETLNGSGTMIIDLEKAKIGKLSNKGLFEMIYKKNVDDKCWKARSQKEKDDIFDNYKVLEIEGTVLGGYALTDYELGGEKGKLLECIFSFKSGGGIGTKLGEEIKKEKKVYAYTKKGGFFEKLGFKKTSEVHPITGSNLYVYEKPIAIIGSSGAVGFKIHGLVDKHPKLKNMVSKTKPGLSKMDLAEWEKEIESILKNNEVVVLAVHDKVAKQIIDIKTKVGLATKIIDCSTAHRTNPLWTYGLPELKGQKSKIENAELVANPGCHATAVILSVKPLVDVNLALNNSGVITSTTGYSGGGKKMIEEFENGKNHPSHQYSTGIEHKHEAEIKNETGLTDFIFQPEVVNYFNGLKVNIFLNLTSKGQKLSEEDFIELFNNYYKEAKNIKVSSMPNDGKISMSENNETQNVSIYIKKYSSKVQIVTVIDNMMKGAAGAVIQNLNIMLGFDEGMGLN